MAAAINSAGDIQRYSNYWLMLPGIYVNGVLLPIKMFLLWIHTNISNNKLNLLKNYVYVVSLFKYIVYNVVTVEMLTVKNSVSVKIIKENK